MKQITAVIKPHRLEAVEKALKLLDNHPGFTLFQARGHQRGPGPHHADVADDWHPVAHDNLVLMMYCDDSHTQLVVDTIRIAAHTGNPGDGLIAVSDVDNLVRIRTGVRDDDAV
ncbi:MAG: P-II family nitrogen regulator [Burkholderiaceae bacterium]|nr:P-II family nitrogen regulator [Burkholderiaceae bacterium]